MFFISCFRWDLARTMGKLSDQVHVKPRKDTLRSYEVYSHILEGTMDHGLLFNVNSDQAKSLVGYIDANYGQD